MAPASTPGLALAFLAPVLVVAKTKTKRRMAAVMAAAETSKAKADTTHLM